MKAFTYLTPEQCRRGGRPARPARSARPRHRGRPEPAAGMKTRSDAAGGPGVAGRRSRTCRGVRLADSGELVVGATTTYADALPDGALRAGTREIAAVAGNLADRPVRTMGTIGGALCAADPRFDMLALISRDRRQAGGPGRRGVRTLAPEDFFRPGGGTSLAPDEILAAIRFPPAAAFTSVVVREIPPAHLRRRPGVRRCAPCGSATPRQLDAARIAVGAVSPVPRAGRAQRRRAHRSGRPERRSPDRRRAGGRRSARRTRRAPHRRSTNASSSRRWPAGPLRTRPRRTQELTVQDVTITVNGRQITGRHRRADAAAGVHPRRRRADRHAQRLPGGALRLLLGRARRQHREVVQRAGPAGRRARA